MRCHNNKRTKIYIMKTLKQALIIGITASALLSCNKGHFCYKGDGEIVTEERNHSGFDEISLATSADIYYVQAEVYSVEIEASQNLMPLIETEVIGDRLKIKRKNNTCLRGDNKINIYISSPEISRFSISGSGNVFAGGSLVSDNLDISISGSGDVKLDSLSVNNIDMSISGSGDLALTSADTADNQNIKISGSGNINAFNLPVKNSKISIAGSGNCRVHAIDNLDVKISGSGDVIYKGTPVINSNIAGSGSLRHF